MTTPTPTLALALVLLACRSPSEPSHALVPTQWGTAIDYYGDCERADLVPHIEYAYSRAAQALGHPVTFDLSLVVFKGRHSPRSGGEPVYGMRDGPYSIVYSCTNPQVVAHELQHVFACDFLGKRGQCCECQDHAQDSRCETGYDLNCQAIVR